MWNVTIEVAGAGQGVVDDALDVMLEGLAAAHGVVSGTPEGHDGGRYGAMVSISASSAAEALKSAEALLRRAARKAGLPRWPIARAEVLTDAELEHELTRPSFPELIGVSELAALAGVSRQRAHTVSQRDDFPEPVATLASGPVWTRDSVTRFIEAWPRRVGRPAKNAS